MSRMSSFHCGYLVLGLCNPLSLQTRPRLLCSTTLQGFWLNSVC